MKFKNVTHELIIEMLATVLDYGYAEVTFIVELCDNFDVNFTNVWQEAQAMYGDNTIPTVNDLIQIIYNTALNRAIDKVLSNLDDDHPVLDKEDLLRELAGLNDINSIESRFYFNDEFITNYDELRDAVENAIAKFEEV